MREVDFTTWSLNLRVSLCGIMQTKTSYYLCLHELHVPLATRSPLRWLSSADAWSRCMQGSTFTKLLRACPKVNYLGTAMRYDSHVSYGADLQERTDIIRNCLVLR
jgi:hypothetical protein